jgi:histidine triad (HIT) family protein
VSEPVVDSLPGCAFCAITHGETPADVVYETLDVTAFLDRRPVFPGHVLLVPNRHVPTFEDLPERDVGPLFSAARLLATAVREAIGADGSLVAVNTRVSQSVPHLHVHIVPRRFHDGLRGFFWPRQGYASDEERAEAAEAIRSAVGRMESRQGGTQ